ncbi:MAG: type II toxin-antitoxin system VapC family toxin [Caldisphaeraceae archaeon]|nr:type II toxin-antitoxin system VapC family toxin [Caldisphaeraceae archaeon]
MIVLDTSFLVKLILEEKGSEKARNLARSWAKNGEAQATIDLALPEALNAVWKHTLKVGDLGLNEATDSVRDLLKIWTTLKVYSSKEVAEEAFRLALEENITVYDALYIQLAKFTRAGLTTFDEKLSRIAVKHGIAKYP